MNHSTFVLVVLCLLLTGSCSLINSDPDNVNLTNAYLESEGVFILNEGNFMSGNGTLSFYSYDSAKIYNNVFSNVNNRPLGDVPYSMVLKDEKAYIVVNNSGKIEVVERNTVRSLNIIPGLVSPRNVLLIDNQKAYVSDLYSDHVTILNLETNTVSGEIDIRRSSEAMIMKEDKAYIANWVAGNEIMVINTITDGVVDSIEVGIEPESMVIDENNTLWVLCNGGWERKNFAELIGINTETEEVIKRYIFPLITDSPSCLRINGNGDTLYFIDKGVKRMSIEASELPETALIDESDNAFYKIGINPVNGDIFIADAVDYQQKGYVMRYKNNGSLIETLQADIIPGSLNFKVLPDPQSE